MLTKYIEAAMKRAQYELIEDEERPYFGTIPGFKGLWANERTLDLCREELQSTLEDWLLIALWENDTDDLPVFGRISIKPPRGSGIKARTRKAS